jgi:hypothetical protein
MKKFFLYQAFCRQPVIEVVAMLLAALFVQVVRLARDLVIEFFIANSELRRLRWLWPFLPPFEGGVRSSSFPSIGLCHVYASFAGEKLQWLVDS